MKVLFNGKKRINNVSSCMFRIFRAALCFIIALSVATMSVYAWILFNRRTDSSGIHMQLQHMDTEVVYDIYRYNVSNNTCVTTYDDGEKIEISSIQMNEYDMIFSSMNKYTPVIIRVSIWAGSGSDIATTGTLDINLYRDTDIEDSTPHSQFSSSVVRFTSVVDSEMSAYLADEETETFYDEFYKKYYSATLNYPSDNSSANSKCFVSVTENNSGEETFAKHDMITLTLNYTDSAWTTVDGVNHMDVFIYLTYDLTLLDECLSENDSFDSTSIGGNSLIFENDLKFLRLHYTRVED